MYTDWLNTQRINRAALNAAWLVATFLAGCFSANAGGVLVKVPTRPGVRTTLFWEQVDDAHATVLLFPGGAGGFGGIEAGRATGGNFLVRSVPYFLANGFNVAIFGRPNDMDDIGWSERTGAEHLADMRSVLDYVKQKSPTPVWIVGTSRGTVSATAMAIQVQDPAIAGLVLTSSVVRFETPGSVVRQDLSAIRLPVLVYHHARDACKHCRPHEVAAILKGLSNAPVKKLMLVEGGANPTGDVCAAQHWHGFVGMEKQAIDTIAGWMRKPVN